MISKIFLYFQNNFPKMDSIHQLHFLNFSEGNSASIFLNTRLNFDVFYHLTPKAVEQHHNFFS